MMRGWPVWACAVLLTGCVPACHGQYEGTAAARALDQKGKDAQADGHPMEALADFRKAIALDPDYAEAYGDEIFVAPWAALKAMGMTGDETGAKDVARAKKRTGKVVRSEVKKFRKLARRHPENPVYLWALGQIYDESDPLKQEQYCRQAVGVDARFAPGYECLAWVANLRGDDKAYSALYAKVAELEPDNAKAVFGYVRTLRKDKAAYKVATERLLQKFPADPVAAQALYWYAIDQTTDLAKAACLERLRQQFAPGKFVWSEIGMEELFEVDDRLDPLKARELAHDMVRAEPKDDDWPKNAAYADAMATAQQELADGHAAKAVSALQPIKPPYSIFDMRRELILNAKALDASGRTEDAYTSLLMQYAKHPTDEVGAALEAYGQKLGKSTTEMHAAIWEAVQKGSTPAIPFTLQGFDDGKPVSLADYRGHVVLVDFWFPNCGPCRQSFPHLENLARKYKDQGVVVLAINGEKGQESFVLPFLRSQGYDFLPLKADGDWAANVYHVRGYPTTFLIGADGRQYFRPRLINDLEQHSAELAIETLLAHATAD